MYKEDRFYIKACAALHHMARLISWWRSPHDDGPPLQRFIGFQLQNAGQKDLARSITTIA